MNNPAYRQSRNGRRRPVIMITCLTIPLAGIGATIYSKFYRSSPSYTESRNVEKPSVHLSPSLGPHPAPGSRIANDTSSAHVAQSASHDRYESPYFESIRPKAHGPLPKSILRRDAQLTARLIREDGPDSAAMIPTVRDVILGKTKALENELDAGVSPNLSAWMGPQGNWSLLCFAVDAGQRVSIKVLVRHGAHVNPSQYGAPGAPYCAPLVLAASAAENDVVRYLLKSGADVNQKSLNGNTALSAAALAGNYYTVKLLLRHGARLDSVVEPNGRLPARLAESKSPRYVGIRKLLLAKGAKMPSAP